MRHIRIGHHRWRTTAADRHTNESCKMAVYVICLFNIILYVKLELQIKDTNIGEWLKGRKK